MKCGKCKDCKFWTGKQDLHMRTCEADFVHAGYGVETKDLPVDNIIIEDDEGWGWFTGPEFGCIHFQKS